MERTEAYRFRYAVRFALLSVTMMWTVKAIELSTSVDLSGFGILPRTLKGSLGILFAPFIHGDVFHLISNTFPFLMLGVGLFYFYYRIAWEVIIGLYFITGFWVWLAARDAYHIGASGVIYGLIFFLLIGGFLQKNRASLAISLVIIFLYGGNMFIGIIPVDNGISWESHLMGALAGIFLAFYYRKSGLSKKSEVLTDQDTAKGYFTVNTNYNYTLKSPPKGQTREKHSKVYHYRLRSEDNSGPSS